MRLKDILTPMPCPEGEERYNRGSLVARVHPSNSLWHGELTETVQGKDILHFSTMRNSREAIIDQLANYIEGHFLSDGSK